MQDRNTQGMQEQLADLGWQRMASLLDAEMPFVPAKERRRRGVLWFWLLALVALLGAGAWAWQAQRKSSLPERPALSAPAPIMAERDERNSGQQVAPPANVEQAPGTAAPPAQKERDLSSMASGVKTHHHLSTSFPPAVPQMTLAAQLPAEDNSPVAGRDIQPVPETPEPSFALSAAPALPPLPVSALDVPRDEPVWTKASRGRNASGFRFGAEAVAGIGASSGLNSAAAGPVAEWRISPKFSLQTGLLAGTALHDLALAGGAMRDASVDPATSGGLTPIQVVANTLSNGYNWTVRMNSLQLPVIAAYRLTPRLSVEAGLTPARAWIAGNDGVRADAESFDNAGGAPFFNYDRTRLESAVSSSAGQWELTASAGMQYRISPHFSLRLHYQHGINDLLDDQYLQVKQRNLRVSGLGYF